MSNRKLFFLAFLIAITGIYGCIHQIAGDGAVVPVSEVCEHPFNWNGKIINLEGFLEVEPTVNALAYSPIPRLFGSRKDALAARKNHSANQVKKAIDLRPSNKAVYKNLQSLKEIICIVIHGKFQAYHGLFIGIGVYESDTGIIDVTGFRKCEEKERQ